MNRIVLFFVIIFSAYCLYAEDSAVVKLTEKSFKEEVLKSDKFWLVEYYAPWCGHCKMAAPEYEKAAQILKKIVNVGAVDMTTDPGAGRAYSVSGYPTIKFFGLNKDKPIDFESSQRTFSTFVSFSFQQTKKQIENLFEKLQGIQQL